MIHWFKVRWIKRMCFRPPSRRPLQFPGQLTRSVNIWTVNPLNYVLPTVTDFIYLFFEMLLSRRIGYKSWKKDHTTIICQHNNPFKPRFKREKGVFMFRMDRHNCLTLHKKNNKLFKKDVKIKLMFNNLPVYLSNTPVLTIKRELSRFKNDFKNGWVIRGNLIFNI